MNFWLAQNGVDKISIGLFSIISLPYAVSAFWAPFIDTVKLPVLSKIFGQRISWIFVLHICMSAATYALSRMTPVQDIIYIAMFAFLIAIFSSTQDVVLGALRSEIIPRDMHGKFAGMYIFGYRIGMLLSSSGAIWYSAYSTWNQIYKIFALAIPCLFCALWALSKNFSCKDIVHDNNKSHFDGSLICFIKNILSPVGSPRYILYILVFLILYRLPDNFINVMINPFLLEKGFDALEIASVGKFLGITAAIIGGFLGSYIMTKIQIPKSLFLFGVVHALAHLMFIVQNAAGNNIFVLFIVMGFESITGGMAMSSYIAFITSLCSGRYRATQYSIFSAMMGLSRSILPGISGVLVNLYGWDYFYFITFLMTIPSLLMIFGIQYKGREKYE
jgi:PAT family beta-lactamase induction signal transducer AmpG